MAARFWMALGRHIDERYFAILLDSILRREHLSDDHYRSTNFFFFFFRAPGAAVLVSFPDPTLKERKGLLHIERFRVVIKLGTQK